MKRGYLMKYFMRWMICVAVMVAAAGIFQGGVSYGGKVATLVIAGSILWLINLLIRPIVQLFALPVTMLTFGLFSLVVNAFMVCLTDSLMPDLKIKSFWICLFIALAISVANSLTAAHEEEHKK